MRTILPTAGTQSRSIVMAVVLGTALSAGAGRADSATPVSPPCSAGRDLPPEVIRDIARYCQACWRNARLPADRWPDCTQQVFTRLLERVAPEAWGSLLKPEGDERREFVRAIDAVKKRTQRARKFADLSNDVADRRDAAEEARDQREEVERAAAEVLSQRQQRIVELSATGWEVPDIAAELGTTAARVSDEKYKAIRKLRAYLGVQA